RALANRVAPLLDEMNAALTDAANSQIVVRGTLRLNVTGAVMPDILPPLIEAYLARHSEVRVEIAVEDRLVDVTALGFDAGVRYGEHLALDVIALPIGPQTQQLALAASPNYLAARGIPLHPTEILEHDCIRLKFSNGKLIQWEMERSGETLTVDPVARLTVGVNAVDSAINFARSGGGIIATFQNWLDADFERGTLLPVLPDWWMSFEGPQLYFSSRFMPPPLRAFVDLLKEKPVNS
ncbi:MAG: LysR substrate-binding domain-containing protein, partial [Dokdonella sp.]